MTVGWAGCRALGREGWVVFGNAAFSHPRVAFCTHTGRLAVAVSFSKPSPVLRVMVALELSRVRVQNGEPKKKNPTASCETVG